MVTSFLAHFFLLHISVSFFACDSDKSAIYGWQFVAANPARIGRHEHIPEVTEHVFLW